MKAVTLVSHIRSTVVRHRLPTAAVATAGVGGVKALGLFGGRSQPKPTAASNKSGQSLSELWDSRRYRRLSDLFIFLNCVLFVLDFLSGSRLKILGVKHNPSIINGEWWRLATCCFLHAGPLHLLCNMYALNNMAPIESVLGHSLYFFIFAASGLAGSFASFMFSPYPSLGASGAVFGIFGATWMFLENNKPFLKPGAKAFKKSIQEVILINAALGFFVTRVDNWGHFGGLIAGVLCAYLFGPNLVPDSRGRVASSSARIPLFPNSYNPMSLAH